MRKFFSIITVLVSIYRELKEVFPQEKLDEFLDDLKEVIEVFKEGFADIKDEVSNT